MFIIRENKGKKKGDQSPNYIVKNIMEMVNISGESKDKGGKWIIEKRRSCPHTVTLPSPSITDNSGGSDSGVQARAG